MWAQSLCSIVSPAGPVLSMYTPQSQSPAQHSSSQPVCRSPSRYVPLQQDMRTQLKGREVTEVQHGAGMCKKTSPGSKATTYRVWVLPDPQVTQSTRSTSQPRPCQGPLHGACQDSLRWASANTAAACTGAGPVLVSFPYTIAVEDAHFSVSPCPGLAVACRAPPLSQPSATGLQTPLPRPRLGGRRRAAVPAPQLQVGAWSAARRAASPQPGSSRDEMRRRGVRRSPKHSKSAHSTAKTAPYSAAELNHGPE